MGIQHFSECAKCRCTFHAEGPTQIGPEVCSNCLLKRDRSSAMPDPTAILAPIRQVLNLAHSQYGVPRLMLEKAVHQAEKIAQEADTSPDGHCQACGKRSASATCLACVRAVEDKPWLFGVGTLVTVFVVGGGIGWVVGLAVGHGM